MLTDRQRLARAATQNHLTLFRHALGRLQSPLTVMNTGAHPDDEQNGMLATLRHQYGMRIVVACSTRGEGGQNILGPERGGALGVMRTREMEEAARVIDADIAWLGHGPDDPVHDFGFSKSGPDTLARWGRERTIERLVRAYRQFRPDIVIPTFLDVPGQHGHHRAMTQAAEIALALAADASAFPEHADEGLMPWRVAKYYLPAWGGGNNGYYDDEVPPPATTTTIRALGADTATGLSYDRLGEISRAFHASQNMGHWRHPGLTEWDLHLVHGGKEADLTAGLPQRLADLGDHAGLVKADAAIKKAISAFPDAPSSIAALLRARDAIGAARTELGADILALHGHRLERKQAEIDAAIAAAANIRVMASLSSADMVPGGTFDMVVEIEPGLAESIEIAPVTGAALERAATRPAGSKTVIPLTVRPDAVIENAFAPDWQSLGGNGAVFVEIRAEVSGAQICFRVDTEEPFQASPHHPLSLAPEAIILPLPAEGSHAVAVRPQKDVSGLSMDLPGGLALARNGETLSLVPTPDLKAGRYNIPVLVDGAPTHIVAPIDYPHIGRTRYVRPLTLDVLALDLVLPGTRVGYISGGSDRVGHWLERMGADPVLLDAETLAGNLDHLDTIIVGIFAFGTRPDLAAAIARLHDWVEKGGHLVTLYHRPSDNWSPDRTPPRRLVVGSPSLRWRVTNPEAPVSILEPDHKLMTGPNRITVDDFSGWNKERGLYFASEWDATYRPLLSMSDAGESPLIGSLLSAEIGRGRHTHTSLVLHHQLDRLVPGAFRIVANLLQKA